MDDAREAAARVRVLLQLNRAEEALKLLGQALAAHSDDVTLHCLRAQSFLKLGRLAEARQAAERALAADPNNEWAHRLRAVAILDQRPSKSVVVRRQLAAEARVSAQNALRLAPSNPNGHIVLARAEALAGNGPKARQAIQKAVELAPTSADAWVSYSQVMLRLRDWSRAEDGARRALALDASNYAAHNNLGAALLGLKRHHEAAVSFATAARLNPPSPVVQRNLVNTGLRAPRLGLLLAGVPLFFLPGGPVYFIALVVAAHYAARHRRVREWGMRRGLAAAARRPLSQTPIGSGERPSALRLAHVGAVAALGFVTLAFFAAIFSTDGANGAPFELLALVSGAATIVLARLLWSRPTR